MLMVSLEGSLCYIRSHIAIFVSSGFDNLGFRLGGYLILLSSNALFAFFVRFLFFGLINLQMLFRFFLFFFIDEVLIYSFLNASTLLLLQKGLSIV